MCGLIRKSARKTKEETRIKGRNEKIWRKINDCIKQERIKHEKVKEEQTEGREQSFTKWPWATWEMLPQIWRQRQRERERFEGGSSAVASNSVYPLWKEEDTVWMDNKTDRRTAELSPDLQQQSAEITETRGRRAGQKVKEEDSWIFDLIRLRMHGRHKPEECFLHSAISCLRPLRGQETNKQEFT